MLNHSTKICWQPNQTGVVAENREHHARTAIQNHHLNDSWSRPLESFFTSFEHKLLDLEEIKGKPIEEVDKRKYLQDAISSHDQLIPSCNHVTRHPGSHGKRFIKHKL